MATQKDLKLNIKALVEGLRDVAALGQEFLKVQQAAQGLSGVGDELDGVGRKTKTVVSELDKAFQSLGGRSTAAIQSEMQKVRDSLEQVRKSGAGLSEIARAEQLAEAAIKKLNAELANPAPKDFAERLKEMYTQLTRGNFAGATQEAKELLSTFGGLTKAVTPLVAGFTALVGIKSFAGLIKDSTELASRVETLNVVLGVVARNAGFSAEGIQKITDDVKRMGITSEAAADSLTKMIQAGINITEVNSKGVTVAAQLARASQDLAVVTGENSSQTLQRLVTNIQQMDTMGLRFMGLTVNATGAQEKFAAAIGKTVGELTESQKKQAFLNATLAEATKLSGSYEEAMDTVGKKLSSLSRFLDEFRLQIGKNFTQAFGVLVDAATDFLRQSEAIVRTFNETSTAAEDLKQGLKPITDVLVDLGTFVVKLVLDGFNELAGAFKQAGGLIGDIANVIRQIGRDFSGFASTVTDGSGDMLAALDPIKGFFTGLGLLLAGLRDAFAVVASVVLEVGGRFADVFGGLIELGAKVVGLFSDTLGEALRTSANNFKNFGASLSASASATIQPLKDGQGAVAKFAEEFGKVNEKGRQGTEAFRALGAEIQKLTEEQKKGATSAEDIQKKYEQISDSIKKAAEGGTLAKGEFEKLNKQLVAVPGTLIAAFSEASVSAGVSLTELRTKTTAEVTKSANLLGELLRIAATKNDDLLKQAQSSVATLSKDVLNLFNVGLDASKTMNDIGTSTARLNQAQKEGAITQKDYADATNRTALKFDELLEAQLKSAKTKGDFERLSDEVLNLGKSGGISAVRMSQALLQIQQEADKTKGKFAELNAATQSLDLSKASLSTAQAQLEVTRASVDLMKARSSLYIAENKYALDGNEINRIGVDIAKLDVQIAEQQLSLARKRLEEQKAGLDQLIGKQRLLNIETALRFDQNNAGLLAEKAAQKEINDSLDVKLLKIQAEVNAQQESVLKAQEAQIMLKGQQDILSQVTAQQKEQASAQRDTTTAIAGSTTEMQKLGQQSSRTTGAIQGMRTDVVALAASFTDLTTATTSWSAKVLAEYTKVSQAINAMVQAQVALDAAGGSGALTSTAGGRVLGNISRFRTDAPTTFDQAINQRNARLTAESAASDAERKAINSQAVDNTGPFLVQEKLRAGTLTEADRGLVEGAYQAAQANLRVVQTGDVGTVNTPEGMADALKWVNITRQAKEFLDNKKFASSGSRSGSIGGQSGVSAGAFGIGGIPQSAQGAGLDGLDTSGLVPASTPVSATAAPLTPVKKISVDLTANGQSVPMEINAADESALLSLLETFKKRT